MIKRIQKLIRNWQKEKEYQKKLAELRKRDPFNYKSTSFEDPLYL